MECSFRVCPNINEHLRWSAGSFMGMEHGTKRLRFLKRFQNVLEAVSFTIQIHSIPNNIYTDIYPLYTSHFEITEPWGRQLRVYRLKRSNYLKVESSFAVPKYLYHYINKLSRTGGLQRID